MLLDAGADVTATTPNGATALKVAAKYGYVDMVTLLIAHGASVRRDAHTSRAWPLYLAVANGQASCVRVLIEANADVHEVTSLNETLLFVAANSGHVDILKLLRVSGGDVNIPNKDGTTPLMTACRSGHRACAAALIEARCNVDAVDIIGGHTALMYAVNFGQPHCVRALQLAEKGIDTGVVAFDEEQGIDMVALDFLNNDTNNADEIRQLLRRACVHCARLKKKMLKCGGRKSVYYCTRECQRADWREHNLTCAARHG
jgi:ankyrin repeat protein